LCSVPTKAVPNPACAYCSLSSEVIGAACSTDADCQGGGDLPGWDVRPNRRAMLERRGVHHRCRLPGRPVHLRERRYGVL
jgi:hypothetical protein